MIDLEINAITKDNILSNKFNINNELLICWRFGLNIGDIKAVPIQPADKLAIL